MSDPSTGSRSPAEEPPTLSVELTRKDERSPPGLWERLEKTAKLLSLVALPFVVALGGWWIQKSIAKQDLGKDYVALAVSLLDGSKEVDPELRAWAVDLLNENAPIGFDESVTEKLKAGEIVLPGPLEGRDIYIRHEPTNLTRLIAKALLRTAPEADLSLFNSGAVRIDTEVPAGELTLETIYQRMLPFPNRVVVVEMPGHLLERVLDQGKRNRGTGGFLHAGNVEFEGGWRIQGEPLKSQGIYTVALNDFLVSGREIGLEYFRLDNPDIQQVRVTVSFQEAVINELLSRIDLRPKRTIKSPAPQPAR